MSRGSLSRNALIRKMRQYTSQEATKLVRMQVGLEWNLVIAESKPILC